MTSGRSKCMEVQNLLGAYSIGATDPQETAFVERYLPECPELVAELAEYMELAEAMLYLPSAIEKPSIADRRVVDIQRHMVPDQAAAQQTQPRPQSQSQPKAQPRHMPRHNAAPVRTGTAWRTRLTIGLGAAVIAMLFGFNAFWYLQFRNATRDLNNLLASLEQTRETQAQFANITIGDDQRHSVVNQDVSGHGSVIATLVWDNQSQVGTFYVSGLNSAAPNQAYNLWLTRDGHTLKVGKIDVNEQRIGVLIFHSEEPISGYTEFLLTAEGEESAEETPSSNHLLTGRI